jgi:hypothetical protein
MSTTVTRTIAYVLSQEGQRAALLAGLNAAARQQIEITLEGSALARAVEILGVHPDGVLHEPGPLPGETEVVEAAQPNTSRGIPWTEVIVDLRVRWQEFSAGLVADHVLTADEALACYMARLEEYAAAMATYRDMETAAASRRDEVRPANAAARAAAKAEADRRDEEEKAAKEAQEAQAAADRAAWIAAHGSPRLQDAEEHGYACNGILVDEIREKVAGILREAGFVFLPGAIGQPEDVLNPSGEGLALLRDVEALRGQVLLAEGQPVATVTGVDLHSIEEEEDGDSRWEEVAVGLHAAGREVTMWLGVPGTERRY